MELANHLAVGLNDQNLPKKDLGRFCRTSRFFYRVCTPVLWRDVDFSTFESVTKMKKFVQQWEQLATKGVLVRSLKIRKAFLVLLMSNTRVISSNKTNNKTPPSAVKPSWVPPVSDLNNLDIEFPPLTRLTKLEIRVGHDNEKVEESICEAAGLEGYLDAHVFAQFCWLIQLNPRLTHLTLHYIHAQRSIDIRSLSRALSGLHHLKHLSIDHIPDTGNWRDAFETIFLSVPETVETLLIKPGSGSSIKESEFSLMPRVGDSDWSLGSLTLRQDPLPRLKKLSLPVDHSDSSSYQWMMDHCINIDTIEFLYVASRIDFLKTLAPVIHEFCHQIRHVHIRQELSYSQPAEFMPLVEKMTAPIETLYIERYKMNLGYSSNTAIQQHSLTLRDIRLYNCEQVDDGLVVEILSRCVSLERFEVIPKDITLSVKIDPLVSQKWACVSLRYLNLTICWGEFEATQPYYLQQPEALESTKDMERWDKLETFYRQIGNLLSLEVLDIKAITPPKKNTTNAYVTFPQLLALQGRAKGRRAYLSWLGRLKNLRQIRGPSFRVSHSEIDATLGKAEAKHMLDVWPKLELLDLLEPYGKLPKRVKGPGNVPINFFLKMNPSLKLSQKEDSFEAGYICPSPGYMLEIWRDEHYNNLENKHLPTPHQPKLKKAKKKSVSCIDNEYSYDYNHASTLAQVPKARLLQKARQQQHQAFHNGNNNNKKATSSSASLPFPSPELAPAQLSNQPLIKQTEAKNKETTTATSPSAPAFLPCPPPEISYAEAWPRPLGAVVPQVSAYNKYKTVPQSASLGRPTSLAQPAKSWIANKDDALDDLIDSYIPVSGYTAAKIFTLLSLIDLTLIEYFTSEECPDLNTSPSCPEISLHVSQLPSIRGLAIPSFSSGLGATQLPSLALGPGVSVMGSFARYGCGALVSSSRHIAGKGTDQSKGKNVIPSLIHDKARPAASATTLYIQPRKHAIIVKDTPSVQDKTTAIALGFTLVPPPRSNVTSAPVLVAILAESVLTCRPRSGFFSETE
ncbi:hypothetical protein BG015_008181 [Linnemannia schmuckeri]|uniref:F-box domain-containing protein n=1 Tax=Linnemannia schmuckeri TaxID=64567 RepID=A0A9P5RZG8_9FUNG|nr:hypothetical protein BG015_008181 [Linnemannia schmuckeri]